MSLTASSSSSRYLEERMLPGNECALTYAKSPAMLSAQQQDQPAVSPRLNNKEPFRPMTRKMLRADAGNESLPLPSPSPSPFTSPIPQQQQQQQQRSVTVALPSANTTPHATPRPERPASPVRPVSTAMKQPALLRSTSPVKLSSPKVARPMAADTTATIRASSPTKARVMATTATGRSSPALARPASPERPSSPVKIRAKITTGVSPKRKQDKNAPPPRPNIVRNTSTAVQATSIASRVQSTYVGSQGLGISVEDEASTRSYEEDSEASGAETSFVFDGASSRGASSTNATSTAQKDAVTVHLRLRPLPPQEPSAWVANPLMASVTLDAGVGAGRFSGLGNHNFDAVHTGSSNDGLYKTLARPLVHSVLSGFNALIFAYGQTASGKTFTLSGDEKSGTEGITQKAIKDLFRGIRASKREREWLVRCSWLEVYNEGVKDLLEPTNVPQVRSSTTRGTFVSPLSEIIVTSPQAVYALLEQGQANRHVNATDWNEKSSRSHTAFKIVVESWARGADEAASSGDKKKVRISELVLVDLAGSEKYVTQGGKERRAEGANINKSLLTLGKVIYALSERTNEDEANATSGGGAGMHIPYRDSKLTRILQSSLSGNSKIAVVATLNQSVGALEESLSTINFAKRIKRVRLSAKLNEVDAPELMSQETQALIVKYRSEADMLRRQLAEEKQMKDEQVRAVVDGRCVELEERLREIGRFVVRGEGDEGDSEFGEDDSDDGLRTPVRTSPGEESSHLDFTVPSSVLRQQLHAARQRIVSLQSKAATSAPALPASASEKDALIAQLRQQLAEAEIAVEANSLQPLPKIREDVEAEYNLKLVAVEKELKEARLFAQECQRECERLERVNRRLVGLAHKETAGLVEKLRSEAGSPTKRGGSPASPAATPVVRRLKGMASHSVMRPSRPVSVLGDTGLGRSDLNGAPKPSATSGNEEDEKSPFSTPRATRTRGERPRTVYGSVATPPPANNAISQPQSSRRPLLHSGTGAGTRARSSSVGLPGHACGLTRSDTVVMSLKSFAANGSGGSDDENADESALLDF